MDNQAENINITTTTASVSTELEDDESSTTLSEGLPQIISTVVTIVFLVVACGTFYAVYRLFCKSRSKHHGTEGNNNRENFDQFDVNCSQLNIEAEEQRFVNKAAKITSESESTSSNISSTTTQENIGGTSLGMLVRSVHGDTRFSVSKVRERSSRPSSRPSSRSSSLKVKLPKQLIGSRNGSRRGSVDEQYSLALIDRKSNTIHNIDISDCVLLDGEGNSAISPASALFAQRWKDKTRTRRSRRSSVEGRPRFIPRQSSCPNAMSAKGFCSESVSSNSDESNVRNDLTGCASMGVSLSSIDETTNKLLSE